MARLSEARARKDAVAFNDKTLTMEEQEQRDQQDMRICASYFITFQRCKICTHLSVEGYVCAHCGGDDSAL
jgi:hypothetical protein